MGSNYARLHRLLNTLYILLLHGLSKLLVMAIFIKIKKNGSIKCYDVVNVKNISPQISASQERSPRRQRHRLMKIDISLDFVNVKNAINAPTHTRSCHRTVCLFPYLLHVEDDEDIEKCHHLAEKIIMYFTSHAQSWRFRRVLYFCAFCRAITNTTNKSLQGDIYWYFHNS